MKRLSVLMPFHNCVSGTSEKVWRRCIESILNQTYSDFDIVAVDDCSTDNSADILLSYKDKRVKYFKNDTNLKLTKSLNFGLSKIATEFVARHDSDDFSEKHRFKTQMRYMDAKHYGVIGSFAYVYDLNLNRKDSQIKPITNEAIKYSLPRENAMLHGSVIMRYSLLSGFGFYDENCVVCQDYELWCRLSKNGVTFYNIPEFLYNRVSHQKCISKLNKNIIKPTIRNIQKKYFKHNVK